MVTTFTFEEASALLPEAQRRIGEVAGLVAELQQLARALEAGSASGSTLPDAKALEARIDEALAWFQTNGVQVKGVAPALLDFPARAVVGGEEVDVLLCWREGEDAIAWYHPPETGYLGREPIAQLDHV